METLLNLIYIISSIFFILGLKLLSSPKTARKGNFISAIAMLIAIVVTLLDKQIISYEYIFIGIFAGSLVGAVAAQKIAMTAIPEMVALFNGFGGGASLLVGWAEYQENWNTNVLSTFTLSVIILAIIIGGITFSGSILAYGKLSGKAPGRPIMIPAQRIVNVMLLLAIILFSVVFCMSDLLYPINNYYLLSSIIVMSLVLGILSVLAIGGADMPVVISLLNSYSGLAACAAGFAIYNNVLIVVGSLVGASGIILTKIMCKGMNRSLSHVLFSGFGSDSGVASKSGMIDGEVKSISVEDSYYILEAAKSVLIVPGYGMAVAQAQHVVRELSDFLEKNDTEVKYAIHPVAGRMPGHMNVLLAEANIPYEQLVQPEDVNPIMNSIDVCIVIGANDVVNLAARDNKESPIYGMPIIEVDKAHTIFVLKRSMNTGFAGLDNPLFYHENTRMIFGDGKDTVNKIIAEFKSA